jgi:transcriptional regulator with XRE-family HTH domain
MADVMPPQVSLRALREHQGLTLDELAEMIREQGVSITRDGLNNCELGARPASEAVLVAWARALGTRRSLVKTGEEITDLASAMVGCGCAPPRRRRRMTRSAA